MILVDTSIWVDHLHRADADLISLLEADGVGCHPYVIAELALGSIADREVVIDLLSNLARFPVLTDSELLELVGGNKLWGQGLSMVDAALLGAVKLVPGAKLWTRDKRLAAAAGGLNWPGRRS